MIFAILVVALTIYVSALYVIQIHDPAQVDEAQVPPRLITRRTTLTAARGNIYDRNGALLVSGRPSYNIKLDRRALLAAPNTNEIVQELIYAAMDEGLEYSDTFPVTRGAPFEYVTNMTTTQRNRLDAYFEYFNLDPEISVSDLLAWMRNNYKIDYTVGILDARLIIGVRYELEIRAIVGSITPYVFSADVGTDFVTYLEERSLLGVYSESTFVREYHTTSAAHLLGYTGAMTAEEYVIYKEHGYPMDAVVGKVGAEFAFEELLHGVSGEMVTRMTEDGTVVSVVIAQEPVPGKHIALTLDLGLQIVSEHALRTNIERINLERQIARLESDDEEAEDDSIPGGAVVVLDLNTGEVLAAASYPSFNLATLANDWAFLNTDPAFPMLNRATQGRYLPGSTFKMVTGMAALRHVPRVTRYFPINDTGSFDRYKEEDFVANCWFFNENRVGHGELDIVQALERSCNYYFLQVSDWMGGAGTEEMNAARLGAYRLAETAMEFGLGLETGLEIPSGSGSLATPEVKEILTGQTGWYAADTLLAGFGQGENRFTPMQLANYAATIGNGGTLYSLSILRSIRSSDHTEILHTHIPEIKHEIEDTDNLAIIQEGMLAVSRGNHGTARRAFGGNYPILVAAKTGTMQVAGQKANDGAFVAYAPADNPQIAIAVVVEKGGSGAAIMDIAKVIIDHYFATQGTFLATPYGEIIP